ncbi:hypothetical protein FSPOR_7176 [Fusarium sporotrichioides]|uniref:Uncharacterized protein n=1 Tax=Fusarium sporotrichioides TaxID=5514 RepID=A0A395RZG6_FUSSP|nr:hypothetical protein FSPOR_7176 [Fusarium sporotrichioides]
MSGPSNPGGYKTHDAEMIDVPKSATVAAKPFSKINDTPNAFIAKTTWYHMALNTASTAHNFLFSCTPTTSVVITNFPAPKDYQYSAKMADHIIVINDDDENALPMEAPPRPNAPPRTAQNLPDDEIRLSNSAIQQRLRYRNSQRGPNTTITSAEGLTLLELQALSTLMHDLSMAIGNVTITVADFRRFLTNTFDAWQTNFAVPPLPVIRSRQFDDTCIQVDWAWRDVKNAGINPQYVGLDDGQNEVTIRTEAMLRYDYAERERARSYNASLLNICAKRIIKKWAQAGTASDPYIQNDDRPTALMSLELSGPVAEAESRCLAQASAAYNAQIRVQHGDSNRDNNREAIKLIMVLVALFLSLFSSLLAALLAALISSPLSFTTFMPILPSQS